MPNPSVTVEDSPSDLFNPFPAPPPITPYKVVPRGHRKVPVIVAVIASAAAAISLLAVAVMAGMLAASPSSDGFSRGMTDVDRACVSVLHNGGMPEDCSRMYHLMPIP